MTAPDDMPGRLAGAGPSSQRAHVTRSGHTNRSEHAGAVNYQQITSLRTELSQSDAIHHQTC
jgi:hypothetical protein